MTIKLERSTDLSIIKSVFLDPSIAHEGDDKLFPFPIADCVYWLLAYKDHELIGCIMFLPIYGVAWNPHIGIFKDHRGCGTEVMRLGVAWMFANTPCRKILAFPFQPIMKRVYEKCGFRVEGQSLKLVDYYGTLIDCTIVGLEK
jgi:RimJ/RimL family protein N-acetyltransferase